ncbi:hypothetical protein [Pseudomonas sp. NFIX28]|uniref:hypothetical protein n=1 Tax=Pseudomonas sp. NFIX28 TaxID=1566235 RepID=UPI0008955C5F|nr:hypothetical protein [Pseudomonas sp. NFIX28]SDY38219.1 hypothetical protein SAMN03159453_00433 [Pseudomonas sp. NFIX28]
MTVKGNRRRWVLGHTLVASAIIAGSIALTMQAKVKVIQGMYLAELQSRLERAKKREGYLKDIESKFGRANLGNVLEMYSVVQEMRQLISDAIELSVEQQQLIELQIEESVHNG